MELIINNNVDALLLTEQKTILSAQSYFITSKYGHFASLILTMQNKSFIIWQPANIDEAIIYLKKNHIIQVYDL